MIDVDAIPERPCQVLQILVVRIQPNCSEVGAEQLQRCHPILNELSVTCEDLFMQSLDFVNALDCTCELGAEALPS